MKTIFYRATGFLLLMLIGKVMYAQDISGMSDAFTFDTRDVTAVPLSILPLAIIAALMTIYFFRSCLTRKKKATSPPVR